MIGQVVAIGTGFRGAMSYLLSGGRENPDPDRVAWTATRNLMIDDPDFAPRLMRATANQSIRCKKPLYHLVISWRQEENPTREDMEMVADTTLGDLDLAEHQVVYVAHRDTDHQHMHIVINRVHPETGRAWHRSNDYQRIELSLARQAQEMKLEPVHGRFNNPERFRDVPRRAPQGEVQANIRHGKDAPLPQFSKEQIVGRRVLLGPAFENAKTWDDLQRGLSEQGMRLVAKGQGLVLAGDDGFMKLSDMGKQIRLGMLEQRFGESFADYDQRREHEQARQEDVPAHKTLDGRPDPTGAEIQPRRQKQPHGTGATDDTPTSTSHNSSKPEQDNPAADRLKAYDEQDIERRREEARQRREQRVASKPFAAADGGQDDAPPKALVQNNAAPPTEQPPENLRGTAFEQLSAARGELDLARAMHKMGIIGDAQLKKSRDELAAARKNLEPHLSLEEKMSQGVWEALKDKKPAPKHQSEAQRKKAQEKERLRQLRKKKKRKQKRQDPEQEQGR